MFTGIVEEIGRIGRMDRGRESVRITVRASLIREGLQVGDSVATNGVCLTVTAFDKEGFVADVMPQTLQHSNLGGLRPGDPVNLERALTLQSRLGGHMVSGHIDGTGQVVRKERDDNALRITISAGPEILRYIIPKGSIAIDGVSLTVTDVTTSAFQVSLIPHTADQTILAGKPVGAAVNLENDLIAKYVEKLVSHPAQPETPSGKGMTLEFLAENGF